MILKIIQIILIVYAIVVGAIIVRDYKKNKEEGVSKKRDDTALHHRSSCELLRCTWNWIICNNNGGLRLVPSSR